MGTNINSQLLADAKNYFLDFVEDDYTQLGFLTGYIRDKEPGLSVADVMNLTKKIIEELIQEKNIQVISLRTERPIYMTIKEIMDEIDKVFIETNGKPDIGDGIWFGVNYD